MFDPKISEADLIINADGTIYHLNLLPEDIGDIVITVGDPDRVSEVSKYFDKIEVKKGKREFITHTGILGKNRITVISTGLGTDNIDIVLNELDALVNIDFQSRTVNQQLKSLKIIRLGTSGSIREDIPVGSILASSYGLGLDALMDYYQPNLDQNTQNLKEKITIHLAIKHIDPYLTAGSGALLAQFASDFLQGITVTAPGFYSPQGRKVRANNRIEGLIEKLSSFEFENHKLCNLEMETAGIYALSHIFGHQAISINAILAQRKKLEFAKNPQKIIEDMIKLILERI